MTLHRVPAKKVCVERKGKERERRKEGGRRKRGGGHRAESEGPRLCLEQAEVTVSCSC